VIFKVFPLRCGRRSGLPSSEEAAALFGVLIRSAGNGCRVLNNPMLENVFGLRLKKPTSSAAVHLVKHSG
jgi:hypothetical protein